MKTLYSVLVLVGVCVLSHDLIGQRPDAEILKYSVNCAIDSKGTESITESFLIQINSKRGENITNVSVPFQKGNKILNIEGEIRDQYGRVIRKLKKRDIEEESYISDISFYEDEYVKKFNLKHNVYPYQIYYTYQQEYADFFHIISWSPVLDTEIPTNSAELTLIVPESYGIKVSQQHIEPFEKTSLNGQMVYSWKSDYLKPVRKELYAPPLAEVVPFVRIVPVHFNYAGEGSSDSWTSFGDWVNELSEGLTALPPAEKVKVKQLIKGKTDKREIVKVLYHYLQDNTRYINVSIEKGGMKPYPAEYVALNKYGDCKALSNYMKALLAEAGIDAYCVDVYADADLRKINENFPSQQFNHVVVCVPLEADTLWLENTDNVGPFAYVGTSIQNRKGLLIAPGSSRLVKIPALDLTSVEEKRSVVYHVNNTDLCRVETDYRLKGAAFDLYSYVLSQFSQTEQEEFLNPGTF